MSGLTTVDYADLEWEVNGTPRSRQFDDVYFSRHGGLVESDYVYLQGNELPARWPAHFQQHDAFQLFEAGFGSGLNFLLTLRAFLGAVTAAELGNTVGEQANAAGQKIPVLRYVAVERYPMRHADLARALALFPELTEQSSELLRQYPAGLRGWHPLSFANGGVELLLIYDDIGTALPALQQTNWRFDCWYLDGFAPVSNQAMWAEALWPAIGQLSRPGATASSFSSAGMVRRGLQSAGFEVRKVPGFGRKWAMTRASLAALPAPLPSTSRHCDHLDNRHNSQHDHHHDSVIIIGAGIAGAATARALAEQGFQVTVLDQQEHVGGTLCHHDAALASPRWSRDHNARSRFQLAGFLQLQRWVHQLQQQEQEPRALVQHDSVLTLLEQSDTAREQMVLTELGLLGEFADWLDPEQASEIAGITIHHQAVRHRLALALAPRALCAALLRHDHIRLRTGTAVEQYSSSANGVTVQLSTGEQLSGQQLILATGAAGREWLRPLPLRPVRGQSSIVPATADSANLRAPLRFGGYLTPAVAGQHLLGASYDGGVFDPSLRAESQQANLASIAWALPALAAHWQALPLSGDVGHRLVSPDRAPLIGRHPLQENVWLNVAHGSHALMTACAGALLLAAEMTGAPAPMPADLQRAVQPARFRQHFSNHLTAS